jgi:hypothetical protein
LILKILSGLVIVVTRFPETKTFSKDVFLLSILLTILIGSKKLSNSCDQKKILIAKGAVSVREIDFSIT